MTDPTRRGVLRAGTAGVAALALSSGQAFAQAAPPKRGGTVVVATDAAPPSLDAQVTSAQEARNINLHMYETLYARDENASPVPDLAQGVQIAKDGLTYTFTLRPGVRFHNGKTMGSRDVVASLERYRKVGASPALLGAVDTIEASGPLEVTIRLKRGQSSFIDSISSPRAPIAIYPAEEAAKPLKDFGYVGTGPFKFVEYAPDSHVTLERFDGYTPNPNYTKRDGFAGRKEVYVDRGIWRFMPESGARARGAANRRGDDHRDRRRPAGEAARGQAAVQGAQGSAVRCSRCSSSTTRVAPCDDVNFRRAVTACLNMEETMAIAYPDINDLDGSWVFPNSPYHTKAGLDLYNQNSPEKAKALLAKSAYKGEKLTFIVDNTSSDTDAATDITQQLAQIGVKIDLKVADWPTVSKIGLGPKGWHFWTHGFGIEPYEGPATRHGHRGSNGLSQIKDDPQIDKLFADFEAEMDAARQQGHFRPVPAPHVGGCGRHAARRFRDVPGHQHQVQELRPVSHPAAVGQLAGRAEPTKGRAAVHPSAAGELGAGAGAGLAAVLRGDLAGAGRPRLGVPRPRRHAAQLAHMRQRLGLDEPFCLQMLDWYGRILHGDLGQSILLNVAASPAPSSSACR